VSHSKGIENTINDCSHEETGRKGKGQRGKITRGRVSIEKKEDDLCPGREIASTAPQKKRSSKKIIPTPAQKGEAGGKGWGTSRKLFHPWIGESGACKTRYFTGTIEKTTTTWGSRQLRGTRGRRPSPHKGENPPPPKKKPQPRPGRANRGSGFNR